MKGRRSLDIHLQRSEVAIVDPDQPGAGAERRLQLALVVRLDERLQAEVQGSLHEPREAGAAMQDGEEQDEVGARGAEQLELAGLDDELLREHGHGHGRPDGRQVRRRAAEPVGLAQDGDRGRAATLVCPRPPDDVLTRRRDGAGRRRRALDLGDEVEPRGRQPLGDRTRRWCRAEPATELGAVERGELCPDVGAPPRGDLGDDAGAASGTLR